MKRSEGRLRLLQKYCDELCTAPEIAQSDLAVEFFWPSAEQGDRAVEAPDGSPISATTR